MTFPGQVSEGPLVVAGNITDLFIAGETEGDIIVRGATEWTRLAAGIANEVLVTAGAGAPPAWNGALTLSGSLNLDSPSPDFTVGSGAATGAPRLIIDRDGAEVGRLEFRADSMQGFTLQVDAGNIFRFLDDGDVTLMSLNQSTSAVRIHTEAIISAALNHDGSTAGFFSTTPVTKRTVTGPLVGNASLLTAVSELGLVTDSTTAARLTFSNVAATTAALGLGTHYAQVGTMTASRILTLSDATKALASATQPVSFLVFDESGTVTGTNTIVLTPESGLINGAASLAITVGFGNFEIYTFGGDWFAR